MRGEEGIGDGDSPLPHSAPRATEEALDKDGDVSLDSEPIRERDEVRLRSEGGEGGANDQPKRAVTIAVLDGSWFESTRIADISSDSCCI